MKYIIFARVKGDRFPVIFPATINHDEYRNFFPEEWNIISAGMVGFDDYISDDFKMFCYGESFSLGVKGRGKEDTAIIKMYLSM